MWIWEWMFKWFNIGIFVLIIWKIMFVIELWEKIVMVKLFKFCILVIIIWFLVGFNFKKFSFFGVIFIMGLKCLIFIYCLVLVGFVLGGVVVD